MTGKAIGVTLLLLPLGLAIAAEGVLALIRHVPLLQQPGPLLQTARLLYIEHRDIIQYLPECSRYDAATTYVLRPGGCEFSSDEFRTAIRANHLGLRDDEESLVRPDMVVLGDSYAFGWGVAQDETFAALIEANTGLRVLNAAISSYGTARELLLLSRIDTSAMRYLVIQYSGNDYDENLAFLRNGGRLEIMAKESFDELTRQHKGRRSYYPGMYLVTRIRAWLLGMQVGRPGANRPKEPSEPVALHKRRPVASETIEQAKAFLDVLAQSPVSLDGVQLVVLALACPHDFTEALHQQIETNAFPEAIKKMKASHLAALLSEEDYFRLDDHLRPRGHAVIAEHVREVLDL